MTEEENSIERAKSICEADGEALAKYYEENWDADKIIMNEMQNALLCELMNVSDVLSKHTESKDERVEKLKEIVQKIMPEKMESYLHTMVDMSADRFGRFNNDDILNMLLSAMKYDLIQYIANI
jgi:hypothetical protein